MLTCIQTLSSAPLQTTWTTFINLQTLVFAFSFLPRSPTQDLPNASALLVIMCFQTLSSALFQTSWTTLILIQALAVEFSFLSVPTKDLPNSSTHALPYHSNKDTSVSFPDLRSQSSFTNSAIFTFSFFKSRHKKIH